MMVERDEITFGLLNQIFDTQAMFVEAKPLCACSRPRVYWLNVDPGCFQDPSRWQHVLDDDFLFHPPISGRALPIKPNGLVDSFATFEPYNLVYARMTSTPGLVAFPIPRKWNEAWASHTSSTKPNLDVQTQEGSARMPLATPLQCQLLLGCFWGC
eukprot:1379345-Amphidinium_carterae.1